MPHRWHYVTEEPGQTCKFASHWHPKAQVAVAKVKGIMKHNQVRISAADLFEHVVAHNADVNVPIHELADHISGSLKPDFQLRYLRITFCRSATAPQCMGIPGDDAVAPLTDHMPDRAI